MFSHLKFSQKIFVSLFFVFLLSLLLLVPFGRQVVNEIVQNSLETTANDLIEELEKQGSEEGMIAYLKTQEMFVFFRVSLIDSQYQLIYDSRLFQHLAETYKPLYPSAHSEVIEAMKTGKGYSLGWSELFHRKFAYIAVRFIFEGKTYILRASFPYTQIEILMRNFQLGIFAVDATLLIFFCVTLWLIFARLSRPIQEIIEAIHPYQKGVQEMIPEIRLRHHDDDDFNRLAETLNSLSKKVREQITSLQEEQNEKEAILESLLEGVVAVDKKGIVRYVNFMATKMLSTPKRHLLGRVFPHSEKEMKAELFEKSFRLLTLAQEKKEVITDSVCVGSSQKIYLDLIATPKGPLGGAVIVLQDKSSDHKVLEMGKDFIANASHELRTPITIIRGFAETLQDLADISPDMLKEITEKIVRNCQRMDTLVKNLLTLADIENLSGARVAQIEVEALFEECFHMLLSVHPGISVSIQASQEKITILGDTDLLELALMNLLENAVKYSPPPAQVKVCIEEKGEDVEVKIADRGIGIPPEEIPYIFERFYTVNKAHSRRLGGAGLGLSIVKTIIEKHEGTIRVESAVGEGTTFILLFPKARTYE